MPTGNKSRSRSTTPRGRTTKPRGRTPTKRTPTGRATGGRTRNVSAKKKKKSGGKKQMRRNKDGSLRLTANKWGHYAPSGNWISNRTATG